MAEAAVHNRVEHPIGGTLTPKKADERGWGWQVKAMMNPATPRPLYNRAKEALLQRQQITSYTISSFDPDLYCEVGKHFDFIWFEMQHSTMSWDEIRRMMVACPSGGRGAVDPHARRLRVQHPEGDRPRRARHHRADGRRCARSARCGAVLALSAVRAAQRRRRQRTASSGRASTTAQTINDNMLVTVMIETLEGVAMAEEIAATHGVDVVILGNNDLSSFSGWAQNDPRYQDAIIKVHDAALKYGKYYGNAGAQYLNGYTVSADTRMVQNGPACDGWTPPGRGGRGRGTSPDEEPVIGLPAGGAPSNAPATLGRGGAANCWK